MHASSLIWVVYARKGYVIGIKEDRRTRLK
jgi:hypothetical protein